MSKYGEPWAWAVVVFPGALVKLFAHKEDAERASEGLPVMPLYPPLDCLAGVEDPAAALRAAREALQEADLLWGLAVQYALAYDAALRHDRFHEEHAEKARKFEERGKEISNKLRAALAALGGEAKHGT